MGRASRRQHYARLETKRMESYPIPVQTSYRPPLFTVLLALSLSTFILSAIAYGIF